MYWLTAEMYRLFRNANSPCALESVPVKQQSPVVKIQIGSNFKFVRLKMHCVDNV